jgi:hypothetical protein
MKFRILLTAAVLLCVNAHATLVIAIFNDNSFYVASDTLIRSTVQAHGRKIFKVSDTCCVSIANCYGGQVEELSGKMTVLYLPKELKTIADQSTIISPLQCRITNIVESFNKAYRDFFWRKVGNWEEKDISTRLCFWGYDKTNQEFFASTYFLNKTNAIESHKIFEHGQQSVGANIFIISGQGSEIFLASFMNLGDEKFKELRPAGFVELMVQVQLGNPVTESEMKKFILMMFDCHKKYAAKYSNDKSHVDAPYEIYKISRDDCVLINQ